MSLKRITIHPRDKLIRVKCDAFISIDLKDFKPPTKLFEIVWKNNRQYYKFLYFPKQGIKLRNMWIGIRNEYSKKRKKGKQCFVMINTVFIEHYRPEINASCINIINKIYKIK